MGALAAAATGWASSEGIGGMRGETSGFPCPSREGNRRSTYMAPLAAPLSTGDINACPF